MEENDQRELPVVDLGRLLSPDALAKLRAARQLREQASRAAAAAALNESTRNESEKTNHTDGTEETCRREEEKNVNEKGGDATISAETTASAQPSSFKESSSDTMHMSNEPNPKDLKDKVVMKECLYSSLGPLKKRKRLELTFKAISGPVTLEASDGIRTALDFAMTRGIEQLAHDNTISCSLVSTYRSIPLSRYRRLRNRSSTAIQNTTPTTPACPSLAEIANYPDYRHQSPWKGTTKVCIMCGERRLYKTRISTRLVPMIRPADKCICTSCQIQVWVYSNQHFKWCRKCKQFRPVDLNDKTTLLTCKTCRQKGSVSRRAKRELMDT